MFNIINGWMGIYINTIRILSYVMDPLYYQIAYSLIKHGISLHYMYIINNVCSLCCSSVLVYMYNAYSLYCSLSPYNIFSLAISYSTSSVATIMHITHAHQMVLKQLVFNQRNSPSQL